MKRSFTTLAFVLVMALIMTAGCGEQTTNPETTKTETTTHAAQVMILEFTDFNTGQTFQYEVTDPNLIERLKTIDFPSYDEELNAQIYQELTNGNDAKKKKTDKKDAEAANDTAVKPHTWGEMKKKWRTWY